MKSERIVRDEEFDPEEAFFGLLLSVDSINSIGSFELGDGSEVDLENFVVCCGFVGDPVIVFPPGVYSSSHWDSHNIIYSPSQYTGTVSQFSAMGIQLGETIYSYSPYGVLIWDNSTNQLTPSVDLEGSYVTIYLDSQARVGLVTYSTDI